MKRFLERFWGRSILAGLLFGLLFSAFPGTPAYAAIGWERIDEAYSAPAGETSFTAGQVVAIKSDGKAYKADADDAAVQPALGVVQRTGTGEIDETLSIVTRGIMTGLTGLTPGGTAFLSATAGAITQTAVAAYPQPIGYAISTTKYQIGVTVDFSGAVTGQGFPIEGRVYQDNIDSNQSATAMTVAGSSTVTSKRAHVAGSVIQITCTSNEARTAGTATFDVTIDGTATGLQAVLDGTNTTSHSASQAIGTDTITAGQAIGVKSSTDASWTPATADIVCDFTYTGVNN